MSLRVCRTRSRERPAPIHPEPHTPGVIALTNVASRQAGWACAIWLFLLGIFAKFGGWVLSIPNCVLGGMTTFLFANVISSGIKILVAQNALKRRERFIISCSLALGIGVSMVPQVRAAERLLRRLLFPASSLRKCFVLLLCWKGVCVSLKRLCSPLTNHYQPCLAYRHQQSSPAVGYQQLVAAKPELQHRRGVPPDGCHHRHVHRLHPGRRRGGE